MTETDVDDRHAFSAGGLSAAVKADGSELCQLRTASGQDLLWDGGPAWPRHAPVLFPVIGELAGQTLRHNGQSYPMERHGLARFRRFTWLARSPTGCRLALADDVETRRHFPFAFRLEQEFSLDGNALTVTSIVINTGDVVLPASCGAHPAFRWPLVAGMAKTAHHLTFAQAEPEPIRRIDAHGLVLPEKFASPVRGRELALDPALFDADAIVMDNPRSKSVRYTAPGAPVIEVAWEGYEQLGIWSKPGADLLCIEPWYGTASPVGWDGDIVDKPGVALIAPGVSRWFSYRVKVG